MLQHADGSHQVHATVGCMRAQSMLPGTMHHHRSVCAHNARRNCSTFRESAHTSVMVLGLRLHS